MLIGWVLGMSMQFESRLALMMARVLGVGYGYLGPG